MYTGLELIIIGYILGFVIHIGFFRAFEGFYRFISKTRIVKPASWCFIWPLAWLLFIVIHVCLLSYCIVEYIVSNQWNFKQ